MNLRIEKSTSSVLPLPVIHTSSLADAQVLASFTSSQVKNGNSYLWILNVQEQFLNVQEQTMRLKNTSWIFKTKVEIQGPFLEFPRVAQKQAQGARCFRV